MDNFNNFGINGNIQPPYFNNLQYPYLNNLQNQQVNQSNTNIIYVNGEDGARTYYVPQNGVVLLLDNDKPLLYKKTVDSTGHFEIKTYEIKECQKESKEEFNILDYVKKSEFETLKDDIKFLKEKALLREE